MMHRTRPVLILASALLWTLASLASAQAAPPTAAGGASAQIAQPAPPAPQSSVQVDVLPQFGQLHRDARSLNMLIRLSGSGEAPTTRAPLDLAIIIDRSGSMGGDKLRDVKAAALKLIDTLQPRDRVTLISYSSDVTRHTSRMRVSKQGRAKLRQHVLSLQAAGGTALGPGLITGLKQLQQQAGRSLRMSHVLLFSDGLANEGEQRSDVLGGYAAQAFTKGVSVSTLGVGIDYNEDLMTKLADQGGGRYHFIKDSAAIASILDDEMRGLVATVARSVELTLRTERGVEVAKLFGYPTERAGGEVRARVGSLGAGQRRDIVLRLELPAKSPERLPLGTLAVHFNDVNASGQRRRIDIPLAAVMTASEELAQSSEQHEVTVRVAEVEGAEKLELAARAADSGKFDDAEESLDAAIAELAAEDARAPSPVLKEQIRDMREAKQEIGAARQSRSARKAYTKKFKAKAYGKRKK